MKYYIAKLLYLDYGVHLHIEKYQIPKSNEIDAICSFTYLCTNYFFYSLFDQTFV